MLNWTVYYNKQLEGGQPWAKIVGVGGIPIPGKNPDKFPGSKCLRGGVRGRSVRAQRGHRQIFSAVSVFEGTYAGTPVAVRIVHSPKRKHQGKFTGGAADSRAVLDCVHETAEALIAIIPR